MPVRLCTEPRCPQVATHRGRCPDHARQRNRDTHRNRHIYNSKRWRILRRKVLFDYPIYQHCDRELATDVDHIRPIERGGDPWALSNLQALCAPCHGRKMKAELS
jgi:5-methylcytosine-specific restriction endonuclease McrA